MKKYIIFCFSVFVLSSIYGDYLYVVEKNPNQVSKINGDIGIVVDTVSLSFPPNTLVQSDDRKFLYVFGEDGNFSILTCSPLKLTKTFTLPMEGGQNIMTMDPCISPSGKEVFIPSASGAALAFDTETKNFSTIEKVTTCFGALISPDGQYVCMGGPVAPPLSIPLTHHQPFKKVKSYSSCYIQISPDSTMIYGAGEGGIVQVSTSTNQQVGSAIGDIEGVTHFLLSPEGKYLYVSNFYSGSVSIISTEDWKLLDEVTVGTECWEMALSGDGEHLFISNRNRSVISVMRTGETHQVETLQVSPGPTSICPSANAEVIYLCSSSGSISVLSQVNGKYQVTTTIPLSGSSQKMVYDPTFYEPTF